MWVIVHGTYFERVGRIGVKPHGPGSVMDWTDAQAASYGLDRLRKIEAPVAAAPDLNTLRSEAEALGIAVDGRWGVPRLQKEIAAKGA